MKRDFRRRLSIALVLSLMLSSAPVWADGESEEVGTSQVTTSQQQEETSPTNLNPVVPSTEEPETSSTTTTTPDVLEIELYFPDKPQAGSKISTPEVITTTTAVVLGRKAWFEQKNLRDYDLNGKNFESGGTYGIIVNISAKEGYKINENNLPKVIINRLDSNANIGKLIGGFPLSENEFYIEYVFEKLPDATINEIKITSDAVLFETGNEYKFKATVEGDNYPSQEVVWSVEGQKAKYTTIDEKSGQLRISPKEIAKELTVKATLLKDSSKFATTIVKIDNPFDGSVLTYDTKYFIANATTEEISEGNRIVRKEKVASGDIVENESDVEMTVKVPYGKEIDTITLTKPSGKFEPTNVENNKFIIYNFDEDTNVTVTFKEIPKPEKPATKEEKPENKKVVPPAQDDNKGKDEKQVTPEQAQPEKPKAETEKPKVEAEQPKTDDKKSSDKKDSSTSSSSTSSNETSDRRGGGGGGSTPKTTPAKSENAKQETKQSTTIPTQEQARPTTESTIPNESKAVEVESVMTTEKASQVVSSLKDTQEITWSKASVTKVIEKGIMKGYPDNKFMPKESVTRAQMAQVISSLIGTKSTAKSDSFNDVKSNKWFAEAVSTVVENKIFVGDSTGNFRPNDSITRAECFVAIAKFKGIAPLTDQETDEVLSSYSDASSVPTWARGYVASMVKAGIVSGENNKLNINQELTREQLATIVSNIVK